MGSAIIHAAISSADGDHLLSASAGSGCFGEHLIERAHLGGVGGPRFGINVGAWMKEYGTRYVLQGGFDGFGFVCWRRSGDGRPSGQPMASRTLDELAEWADRYEAQASKPAGS